jgi:imidazolonepropionase-like amidohydrolase
MHSVDGLFRAKYDGPVDETIDLRGRFIIPPFAEAHTHHFIEGMDYREQIAMYFAQGIFYAKNTNSMQKLTDPIRHLLNKPDGIDVIFSNGGLTATGGHPIQIYDYLGDHKIIPGWTKEDMKNQAYFIIDSEADLDAMWGEVKAGRPDFIKTYLEYSEEYEKRKSDPRYYGQRGLDPRLLPKIVARAHRDNLRVSVHINTAADFRNAVAAGVDEMTHLPLGRIEEEDARRAARQKIVVVTTTMSHRKTDHVTGLDEIHRHNLRLLSSHGVKLAVGTDDTNITVIKEAENLQRLGVFDNATLLRMWTSDTPQTMFPGRPIGYLKDGYEASFIALDGDPVKDFSNVRKVSLRFKQGQVIEVKDAERLMKPTEPRKH